MKENKGVLKGSGKLKKNIVTACIVAGMGAGIAGNAMLWKPQANDAESIYNRKMQAAQEDYQKYTEKYEADIHKAIEAAAKKNVSMSNVEKELMAHLSNKYTKEAEEASKIIKEHTNAEQERLVQFGILTVLSATAGAAAGQVIGGAVGSAAQSVSNGVQAVKSKVRGRRKEEEFEEEYRLDDNDMEM